MVGSVVCTVYTDGQPYNPCVLCETGFKGKNLLPEGKEFAPRGSEFSPFIAVP